MKSNKIESLLKHHIEDIVVITDKYGFITWTNDWFTKLTEYSFEEVKGKKPGDILQGKDTDISTVEKMRSAIITLEKFNVNVVNYSKTGKKYWLNINCIPVFNDDNEIECFIAIERDITSEYEQNQAKLNNLIEEQQRLSNEKSELIELIYILTHDLKAPLHNIKGLAEILQTQDHDIIEMLTGEVTRSVTLINKILANRDNETNRIDLEFSDFNLLETIKKLKQANNTNLTKNKLNICIDHSCDAIIKSDKVLINQILENLFINAIKYAKTSSKVNFKLTDQKNYFKIIISNKTDILHDWQLNKLFKPFQNFNLHSSQESNGMGLYIVKKYIDLINGTVNVFKENSCVFFEVNIPKELDKKENRTAVVNLN